MKRKFRITLWVNEAPFSAFCKTMWDALILIEKATGKPLEDPQRRNVIDVMVAMLMADRDVDCSLPAKHEDVRISLSYIDPLNVASIVG